MLVVYRGKLLQRRFTKTYHTYGDNIDSSWLEVNQQTNKKSGVEKTKLAMCAQKIILNHLGGFWFSHIMSSGTATS